MVSTLTHVVYFSFLINRALPPQVRNGGRPPTTGTKHTTHLFQIAVTRLRAEVVVNLWQRIDGDGDGDEQGEITQEYGDSWTLVNGTLVNGSYL